MLEINKLYCMDNVLGMKLLPDNSVDLTVTSPPYGNLRKYTGYDWNFEEVANQIYRVTKIGGIVVWVVGDQTIRGSETGDSFKQVLYFMELKFNLHDTMIYRKENYVPLTHNRYEQSFEYMFIFSKKKPKTFNPIKIPCKQAGKIEKYGQDRRQNHGTYHSMRLYKSTEYKSTKSEKIHPNIFSYTLGKGKTGHPAPFPEQLAHDHIISWSNIGDLVLDPFVGSGTTAKIAKDLGRNFVGFDISQKYIDLANDRIR
jgi:DNA modification methylase